MVADCSNEGCVNWGFPICGCDGHWVSIIRGHVTHDADSGLTLTWYDFYSGPLAHDGRCYVDGG